MVALVVLALLGGALHPPARDISPAQIRAMIAADGAKAVVDRLYASGRWWDLTRQLSSGEPKWVALAPVLSNGTDGATSETLTISLAAALPRATAPVLSVLDPTGRSAVLSVRRVCSSPFVEDSAQHQRAYKAMTLRRLARVTGPRLRGISEACAGELRKVG